MPFCVLFGLRFRVFGVVLSSLRLCFLFIEKEKEHEVAWVGDWDASGRTWGRENNYDQNTIYKNAKNNKNT